MSLRCVIGLWLQRTTAADAVVCRRLLILTSALAGLLPLFFFSSSLSAFYLLSLPRKTLAVGNKINEISTQT